MSDLTRKWVEFEADAVDYHINHSRCRLDRTERKRLEAYLVVLKWALEADAALRFICEMEDTGICECEGCSCDIEAMAEAARAARLPEEKP